jgi:hypothetical protein
VQYRPTRFVGYHPQLNAGILASYINVHASFGTERVQALGSSSASQAGKMSAVSTSQTV